MIDRIKSHINTEYNPSKSGKPPIIDLFISENLIANKNPKLTNIMLLENIQKELHNPKQPRHKLLKLELLDYYEACKIFEKMHVEQEQEQIKNITLSDSLFPIVEILLGKSKYDPKQLSEDFKASERDANQKKLSNASAYEII